MFLYDAPITNQTLETNLSVGDENEILATRERNFQKNKTLEQPSKHLGT